MSDIDDWPENKAADPHCNICLGDGLQADGETPCPCIRERAEVMHIACCFRSGEIVIVSADAIIPDGVIAFARGAHERLEKIISTRARHSYHAEHYLVPGVPEADDGDAAVDALSAWVAWAFADCADLLLLGGDE